MFIENVAEKKALRRGKASGFYHHAKYNRLLQRRAKPSKKRNVAAAGEMTVRSSEAYSCV
jgi:hypothetical protein